MQDRLRSRGNRPMLPVLEELERKLEQECRPKAEAARQAELMAAEEKWQTSAMKEKADINPKRLLEEQFPAGEMADEAISITLYGRHKLQEAASALGLLISYREVKQPSGDRLVVIGRSEDAINAVLRSVDREKQREQQRKEEEDEAELMELHRDVLRMHGKKKEWNTTGAWRISCDAFQGQWNNCDELTLDIYTERVDGKLQMFAEFDFGIVSGIFRFEKQLKGKTKAPKTIAKAKAGHKGKSKPKKQVPKDYSEDDGWDHDPDDDESPSTYTINSFYLLLAVKPTPSVPRWSFRWRGEEREGPICLGSDEVLYNMTFAEPKGTKLSGTFGGGPWGKCNFTGTKVGMGGSWGHDISSKWSNSSQAAYDEAERNRWR